MKQLETRPLGHTGLNVSVISLGSGRVLRLNFVDAIRKRPAVIETSDGDFIAARLTGMLGQSFDHRAFDGACAAAFLSKLKSVIETRDWAEELSTGRAG